MAEAVVTFFLQKLDTLVIGEANLLQGVDEEITLLKSEMEWMRLFIKNADAKRRSDPEMKLMVKQIRELTFKAEDVIDEFILKIPQDGGRRRTDFNWFTRSVKSIVRCTRGIHHLPLCHKLGNQIKAINKMSEKITTNKSKYCIEGGSSTDVKSHQIIMRAPIAEEQNVVGFEDSTKQVVSLLVGSAAGDCRRRRIVVSIVGMGGLGKTTLAKKVYNNSDVKRNFNCFAWISVSQEYTLKDLLKSIILKCVTTISMKELMELNEEELRNKLYDFLMQGDKKYLIVLDDTWDLQAWDGLNTAFPDQRNGSRVLLTTRNKTVGIYADSSSDNIHELRFLNEEESWELFLKKVFALGGGSSSAVESKCPIALEEMAKEMVEKCGRLPLAILVLGGLLSSKDKTFVEWSKVNINLNWHLRHGASSHSCSGILALSYYDLPYYLKPFFLYVALFPEDYEIAASMLFRCWIAEGFVQSRGSEETLEDIAEDYLGELIHRSMIQVGGWRYDGRVRTCRVHDLLRDLAIAESKEDQFSQVFGSSVDVSESNIARRLTIHGRQGDNLNVDEQYLSQFSNARCVRSIICFGIAFNYARFLLSLSLSGRFKLLKVLDVDKYEDYATIHIPKEMGELIHLKYLRFNCPDGQYVVIPNSFFNLANLQTLNFELGKVYCLPSQFLSLRQLRHLKVRFPDMSVTPRSRILGIDNLTDLQSLNIKIPSCGVTNIIIGKLDRLRMLKKLKIHGIPRQDSEIFNDIAKLTGLRSLALGDLENYKFPALMQFSGHSYLTKLSLSGRLSSEVLFPPNLIYLSLSWSKIETDQMVEALAKLQNLERLKLSFNAYIGKRMVVPQRGFPRIQVLGVMDLDKLEELIVEEGALISLTHFTIRKCQELKMLPDGLRQLTKLEELKVLRMPFGFMGRLKENEGEDWEKIKHIPSVIISRLHWVN